MRIAYYPDTDSMYIDLSDKPSAESREKYLRGVVLDYDEDGNIAGIDIDICQQKTEFERACSQQKCRSTNKHRRLISARPPCSNRFP